MPGLYLPECVMSTGETPVLSFIACRSLPSNHEVAENR